MKFHANNRAIDALKFIILLFFSWIGVNQHAHGQMCNFPGNNNASSFPHFTFNNPSLPFDAPDGAVLATATIEQPFECQAAPDGIGGYSLEYTPMLHATQFPDVGRYGGSGNMHWYVGYRVTNMATGKVFNPSGNAPQEWAPPITSTKPVTGSFRAKIELIKISDNLYNVKEWPYGPLQIGNFRIRKRAQPDVYNYRYLTLGSKRENIKPMPESCTIVNSSVDVRLPPVSSGKLGHVGASAGETGFNIGLNCRAGSNVYVTLTDLTDPGNTGDQLTLTQDSTAKGVKLRISRNGQPVRYGPDSRLPGNPNQWYVGPSVSTSNIPLTAQYVADGPVSGGTVKGVATFTMSYQ
ncbi:fimbrial protein [Burkholderia cepacia]|uniref:Fimbrial protein n=1 Tax=Burkholderia cepacia GG4 TaxID=1009846 RepID=A0A9W3P7V7_BURCE|nr:fimbrial protein [Burkholderia cepacia]AFQ46791.1 fimbrial protein [Burkholderia cepacia GG4]